jgi:hypothetical protein
MSKNPDKAKQALLERFEVRFELVVIAPLHCGDGERRSLKDMRSRNSADSTKDPVNTVQRDYADDPVLEASSLKGAMRSHATAMGLAGIEALFGKDDVNVPGDSSGSLRLHAARWQAEQPALIADSKWPDWRNAGVGDFANSFILPGIRIDRDTGAVEDGKFYRTEFLPAGARFCCGFDVAGRSDALETAARLLGLLSSEGGFPLGAVTATGFGRVQADPASVTAERCWYDVETATVKRETVDIDIAAGQGAAADLRLELTCEGPFFIRDERRDVEGIDMSALSADGELPVLTGKALLQELRRQSAWLEALQGKMDDPGRHLLPQEEPGVLTRTQRLFGVPGYAKRLRIDSVKVGWTDGARTHKAQGIKLDVFTQGPIDGALLTIAVPAGVKAGVTLSLVAMGNPEHADDKAHLDALITRIAGPGRGIRLGHSTGTGFGAFAVKHLEEPAGEGA